MRFWLRELAGWLLVGLGVFIFLLVFAYLQAKGFVEAAVMAVKTRLRFAAASDPGKRRKNNEDRYYVDADRGRGFASLLSCVGFARLLTIPSKMGPLKSGLTINQLDRWSMQDIAPAKFFAMLFVAHIWRGS